MNWKETSKVLSLENKGLRVQNGVQSKKLEAAERELKVLRRFKNLVDRIGMNADKLLVDKPVV